MSKLVCSVPGCERKHSGKGHCRLHRRRVLAQGDPYKILIDHNMAPGESSFNWLFYIYKKNATRRKISFELDKDIFRKLTKMNCSYCGTIPSNKITGKSKKGFYIYNGIDRINPELSYNEKNCVASCTTCNVMKMCMTVDDFLGHIKRIYSHTKENLFKNDEII